MLVKYVESDILLTFAAPMHSMCCIVTSSWQVGTLQRIKRSASSRTDHESNNLLRFEYN